MNLQEYLRQDGVSQAKLSEQLNSYCRKHGINRSINQAGISQILQRLRKGEQSALREYWIKPLVEISGGVMTAEDLRPDLAELFKDSA